MPNNFKDNAELIKNAFREVLKENSTAEDIEKVNGLISVVEDMVKDHDEQIEENAKLSKVVVNMVKSQGNDIKPNENVDESKPKTFEQIMSDMNS